MAVKGRAGLVLGRLWERAPWAVGAEAFVWVSRDTLGTELGMSRTAVYRATRQLERAGWIVRETKTVRYGRESRERRGWVLMDRQSDGELFAHLERDGDASAEPVDLDRWDESVPAFGTTESRESGFRSSIGTGIEPNSSSAPAREPGEDDEDQDGYWDDRGNRLPAPFKPAVPTRTPAPTPNDPPPDAALVKVWEDHERSRSEALGDSRRLRPTIAELDAIAALEAYVGSRDGVDASTAWARVARFAAARVQAAAKATREGTKWAAHFRRRCVINAWAPELYESVMATAETKTPAERRRAKEWVDDDPIAHLRRTLYAPEPEPAPSDKVIDFDFDAFFAQVRSDQATP
jgi:hypothetical protein